MAVRRLVGAFRSGDLPPEPVRGVAPEESGDKSSHSGRTCCLNVSEWNYLPRTVITEEQFRGLLPLACAWAGEQERVVLRDGQPLTRAQTADAVQIGVAHPERVRLLRVVGIPIPEHPVLRAAAAATLLISPLTAGLTLRYGIFIRADCWGDRRLVFHELVHTLQYERLGGLQPFLQQYLHECITIGYPASPMEQEAVVTTARFCP